MLEINHIKMITNKKLIKIAELAKALDLKPRGVQSLVNKGKIPCYKISRRCVRFDLQEVLTALERFRVN
jgi:excisionase family DNA binding protein